MLGAQPLVVIIFFYFLSQSTAYVDVMLIKDYKSAKLIQHRDDAAREKGKASLQITNN